ncbi:hypothetical protein [Agrobacterium pusense]|uniref:hypothetical protein n=1 Tax=Agrobacterium pusense TaxID=648995 RepID=UPI000DD6C44A|nr:hypothetical protein [Agrobacterium pusense]MDH0869728.1 hypothetical protein [Agrobacterium pusense]
MKCSKTQQSLIELKTGNEAKAMSVVDAYSPEEAVLVAKKMFQRECAGWGDEERALNKVARQCGMTATSFKRLMKGQRKVMDVLLCKRIRLAYLNVCHALIAQVQNDIQAIEEAYGHDAVADIFDEAEALGSRVHAAKAAAIRSIETTNRR